MADDVSSAGNSIETAIVLDTTDPGQTIGEEYRHLERLFGTKLSNWFPVGRTEISRGGRTYEQVEIQIGQQFRKMYFDITSVQPK
jgi:hypothetical protein